LPLSQEDIPVEAIDVKLSQEKNESSQEDVSLESIDLKLSEEKNKCSEVIRSRPSLLKKACLYLK